MLLVESLSVAYGQSRVLMDVSLDVPDGSVACLMGRNGVGKTTFMKSVMGLLKASTGKVTFQGDDMTTWPPHKRARAGLGYVPQGRQVFPFLSIHQNLLMGLEATKGKRNDEAEVENLKLEAEFFKPNPLAIHLNSPLDTRIPFIDKLVFPEVIPADFNVENALKIIGFDTSDLEAAKSAFKLHFIQEDLDEPFGIHDLKVLYQLHKKYL